MLLGVLSSKGISGECFVCRLKMIATMYYGIKRRKDHVKLGKNIALGFHSDYFWRPVTKTLWQPVDLNNKV